MSEFVPAPLLFDFQLTIPRCANPSSGKSGRLLDLPGEAELFVPSSMESTSNFASLKAAWNEEGFAFSATVSGKQHPAAGSGSDLKVSDHILLWLDTRPTGSVHRATEYCQHLAIVPVDDEVDGDASIHVLPIAQQRQSRLEPNTRLMKRRIHSRKDGYTVELWIPGSQMYGYREIAEIGRLGFYCVINDSELGTQHLTVDDSFPYSYDPSLWLQLELA